MLGIGGEMETLLLLSTFSRLFSVFSADYGRIDLYCAINAFIFEEITFTFYRKM